MFRSYLVFTAFMLLSSTLFGSRNLDSFIQKVMRNYIDQTYLEYDVKISKFDSSRKVKLTEGKMSFKFRKPEYYANFDNQFEKIYLNNIYLEVNHLDSIIYINKNPKLDSNFGSISNYIDQYKIMDMKYEIESEDDRLIKLKVLLNVDFNIPEYYMSMTVDKKTNYIVQNQMNKREKENGNYKIFFYQIDMYQINNNPSKRIEPPLVYKAALDLRMKETSKYKRYKLENKTN